VLRTLQISEPTTPEKVCQFKTISSPVNSHVSQSHTDDDDMTVNVKVRRSINEGVSTDHSSQTDTVTLRRSASGGEAETDSCSDSVLCGSSGARAPPPTAPRIPRSTCSQIVSEKSAVLSLDGASKVVPRSGHVGRAEDTAEGAPTGQQQRSHSHARTAAAAASQSIGVVPHNSPWRYVELDDGRVYYYNMLTQKTSWTLPVTP
jgi:hypothetical protein